MKGKLAKKRRTIGEQETMHNYALYRGNVSYSFVHQRMTLKAVMSLRKRYIIGCKSGIVYRMLCLHSRVTRHTTERSLGEVHGGPFH